jgi:thiamine pyrophosphate-dependent acetolactate synthase large subunit-like protein
VSDQDSHCIRKIEIATQKVMTITGTGSAGNTDGYGTAASLAYPFGIVMNANGDLYVQMSIMETKASEN